jgi:suppressor for copper-sensitivity B
MVSRKLIWPVGAAVLALGAVLALMAQRAPAAGQEADGDLRLSAQFTAAKADEPARLYITAELEEGWHTFSVTQPKGGPRPTKIVLAPSDDYKLLEKSFTASPPPEIHYSDVWPGLPLEEHSHRVVWHVPIEIAAGVDPADVKIEGKVNAQRCEADRCLPPKNFPFDAALGEGVDLGESEETGDAVLPAAGVGTAEPPSPPSGGSGFDPARLVLPKQDMSMFAVFALAYLGGLILNVMPCVLPVIGLKILAFVEQAGESRGRVFLLNVWYCLGLISVFMALALLAVLFGLNWGQQFTSVTFNVVLASVVFVFSLSFLGVWEIPIPGFVGGRAANELAQKEGPVGAFSKGILTTVLATPCTGPFMGPALAWAAAQPALITFTTFGFMGLGMATPYLLIGAFPHLIRVLPKPGAWMETFKQMMGFVLLGTVVFILTFIPWTAVVPTVAVMIGLWAACWWIGRTPLTANTIVKVRAWCAATTFAMSIGLLAFGWLDGVMERKFQRHLEQVIGERFGQLGGGAVPVAPGDEAGHLPWQPFSRDRFEQLAASQTTILVDFTADW